MQHGFGRLDRRVARSGSGTGPILLSQATFLLAHIANSGPVPLSRSGRVPLSRSVVSSRSRPPGQVNEKQARQKERLVDVNTASAAQLESLPEIGPALARRIIEGRPYRKVDDLLRIKGIGEGRLAEVRRWVIVR